MKHHYYFCKNTISRIIRDLAGVTSGSTKQAGFAFAHTLTSRETILNCSTRQSRKFGFTLAEVLITLGIIGIVAALTIPTLIQKHNEKVWVTSYLRVYSILENAYKRAQEENGTFENWFGGTITVNPDDGKLDRSVANKDALYNVMLKPYLNINDFHKDHRDTKICMSEKAYHLDGSYFGRNNAMTVSLPSGECIELGSSQGDFVVDLNSKKGPNTLGKDIHLFSFDIANPRRIKPGFKDRVWTDTPAYCDVKSAHGWNAGASCGFWIVRYHNMDYLHLPYEELKQQWRGSGW